MKFLRRLSPERGTDTIPAASITQNEKLFQVRGDAKQRRASLAYCIPARTGGIRGRELSTSRRKRTPLSLRCREATPAADFRNGDYGGQECANVPASLSHRICGPRTQRASLSRGAGWERTQVRRGTCADTRCSRWGRESANRTAGGSYELFGKLTTIDLAYLCANMAEKIIIR